jgi:hypothetical protein
MPFLTADNSKSTIFKACHENNTGLSYSFGPSSAFLQPSFRTFNFCRKAKIPSSLV